VPEEGACVPCCSLVPSNTVPNSVRSTSKFRGVTHHCRTGRWCVICCASREPCVRLTPGRRSLRTGRRTSGRKENRRTWADSQMRQAPRLPTTWPQSECGAQRGPAILISIGGTDPCTLKWLRRCDKLPNGAVRIGAQRAQPGAAAQHCTLLCRLIRYRFRRRSSSCRCAASRRA